MKTNNKMLINCSWIQILVKDQGKLLEEDSMIRVEMKFHVNNFKILIKINYKETKNKNKKKNTKEQNVIIYTEPS